MKQILKDWGVFTLVIAIFILTRIFIWNPIVVDGPSMDPTLADGEHLLLIRTAKIDRFDIVVAKETVPNGKDKLIVKRVIGMPGDTIEYKNDVLYVNGKKTDEPYLKEYLAAFQKDKLQSIYTSPERKATAKSAQAFTLDTATINEYNQAEGSPTFRVTVPDGEYFLLGDNRLVSLDSRMVGNFKRSDIQGQVVFRFWPLWPLTRIGSVH